MWIHLGKQNEKKSKCVIAWNICSFYWFIFKKYRNTTIAIIILEWNFFKPSHHVHWHRFHVALKETIPLRLQINIQSIYDESQWWRKTMIIVIQMTTPNGWRRRTTVNRLFATQTNRIYHQISVSRPRNDNRCGWIAFWCVDWL